MSRMNIDEVYEIEEKCKPLYKYIHLKNVFKKYPQRIKGARFAFLCPGAMKTIEYLHENSHKIDTKVYKNILLLTNFQFFLEIFVIYEDYINKEVYKRIKTIVKNKSCEMSNIIKDEINILFSKLPKRIFNNLPDKYYHKRHDMLICTSIKTIGNASILLLKSLYGSAENFENKNSKNICLGKRNGVSGCRDCCKKHSSDNYSSCVDSCMDF